MHFGGLQSVGHSDDRSTRVHTFRTQPQESGITPRKPKDPDVSPPVCVKLRVHSAIEVSVIRVSPQERKSPSVRSVKLSHIDPWSFASGQWVVMRLFGIQNRLQIRHKLSPIGMNVWCIVPNSAPKENLQKFQKFVLVEHPFVEDINDSRVKAHFTTTMQRHGVIQPRVISMYLLGFV